MLRKRLLSFMLVLCLILPMVASAFAVETTTNETANQVSQSTVVKPAVKSNSSQTGYDRGYTGGMAGTGEYKAFGLDVSSWQGANLDFNMIKNAGYDYVILRAGTTYGKDGQFENYYVKAKAAGLDVGAYYFSYALDVATVKADAEKMISYLEGKKFEYPIYFDYEDPSQLELSSSLSQQICLTFMDMLADEGYLVGLYTGKYFSTQIPISTICAKYEIWIAHYLVTGDGVYDGTDDYTYYGPSYSTKYGMYQFTDSVWINGNGHYDGDVSFKDYPAIVKQYGFNGYEAQGSSYFDQCVSYPAHCQINVTRDQAPVNALPCSVGTTSDNETLESAPAGSVYTATGLYRNSYGNYWYEVITKSGETGYIYAGEATYMGELTSDIALTDYNTPNGHVSGDKFYVEGIISSQYNQLNSAAVWVYSGFGTSGSQITGGTDTISDNQYDLENSDIDFACAFNEIPTGNYTYAISVNYTNYYAEGATTLKENTKTLYLCDTYFVVIPSSVSQSSCAHSYTTTNLGSGGCAATFIEVKACSICGHIVRSQTSGAHSYGNWTTISATCTTAGYKVRTCSVCGHQEKETYTALGHNYSLKVIDATCQSMARYEYSCATCGDSYSYSGEELQNVWLEELPVGMDPAMFTTKTQYRYTNRETTTSYSTALSGYTLKSSTWEKSGTGKVTYVKNWHSGFADNCNVYYQYDNINQKVTASETATSKTEVNSDGLVGYLWFHWCCSGYSTSSVYKTDTYWYFHAFYSTISPSQASDYDVGDGSYKLATSTLCSDCLWYWPVEVYEQNYTTYNKLFTYEKWSDWSEWSDDAIAESANRKVETRTLYRYNNATLGDHSWSDGVVTTVAGCTTNGVKTYVCNLCNETKTESIAPTGHSWKDANCYTAGLCVTCGYSSGTALGHDYVTTVLVAPGCATEGTQSHICSRCDAGYVDGIPATGHHFVDTVTLPTCTTQGYTTRSCEDCSVSYQIDYVRATGHNYVSEISTPAGCTTNGITTYTCTGCGDSYIRQISFSGHRYVGVVTAPTCTEEGYTTYTCMACCKSYVDCITEPLGHSYAGVTCEGCGSVRDGDYYLIGYINGALVGCGNDYANAGSYQFRNGSVCLTTTSACYVYVKTGDNQNWYMADGVGASGEAITLYNTNQGVGADKLYIPAGATVTFTLTVNANDTLVLSYVIE